MSALDELHDKAMEKTFFADLERRRGNANAAMKLFEQALDLELKAIAQMADPTEPTHSILHRSAGWLALDCDQPRKAERLATNALACDPPPEIAEELRDLLNQAQSRLSRGADAWGHTVTALLGLVTTAELAGEELITCAKSLDKHYIPARYPNGFDAGAPVDFYTKKDSDDAIPCAERLISFARSQIEQPGER